MKLENGEKTIGMLIDYVVSEESSDKDKLLTELLSIRDRMSRDPRVVVEEVLDACGVPANILGYDYIVSCVLVLLEHPEFKGSVMKSVYPVVAKNHRSTVARVERCVRHAVQTTFARFSVNRVEVLGESWCSYFNNSAPTNTEFIYKVLAVTRRQMGVVYA